MGRTACTEPQCMYKGALYLLLHHVKVVVDKVEMERSSSVDFGFLM